MAGQLFRAGAFEPLVQPDEYVALVTGKGDLLPGQLGGDNPFYKVATINAVPSLGQHGIMLLWSDSNTIPSGYALFPGGVSGQHINAGTSLAVTPTLGLLDGELFQARFVVRPLATLGVAVQDIDVQFAMPAGTNQWFVGNTQGRFNMQQQFPLPGDDEVNPAQGSNITVLASTPYAPVDWSHVTEFFAYGVNYNPTFTIINNGSANTSGGGIGLLVQGYRLILKPAEAEMGWTRRDVLGSQLVAPPRELLRFAPIAAPQALA